MSYDPTQPEAAKAKEPDVDPLAAELLAMGSFDDVSASTGSNVPSPAELEALLGGGRTSQSDATPAPNEPAVNHLPATGPFDLPHFKQVMKDAQASSIDLLRDVELNVKIELGRSRMLVEDVLKLSEGSVVELDKLAGDPVDVFVNDRLVARGEVLVLNDNFCVRVNEIVATNRDEL